MNDWWSRFGTDLYSFFGELLSPAKLHEHFQTALTSWPLALIVVAFAFRKLLAKLISSMRRLSYKDGSREVVASWDEGLRELKQIEQATEAEQALPAPQEANEFNKLMALAKVSTRSAVIEAWLSVENAARALIEPAFQGTRPLSPPSMLERELWKRELIGPGERELFSRLRALRNEATHLSTFEISEEKASEYINTALSLTARLNQLKAGL